LRNTGFLVQTAISLIFYPFIQELTKEQYHSHPYLFSVSFTHPLITHDSEIAEYSPGIKTETVQAWWNPKKYPCPGPLARLWNYNPDYRWFINGYSRTVSCELSLHF